MIADIPSDETGRLSALRELNILDTEAEKEFDELFDESRLDSL